LASSTHDLLEDAYSKITKPDRKDAFGELRNLSIHLTGKLSNKNYGQLRRCRLATAIGTATRCWGAQLRPRQPGCRNKFSIMVTALHSAFASEPPRRDGQRVLTS